MTQFYKPKAAVLSANVAVASRTGRLASGESSTNTYDQTFQKAKFSVRLSVRNGTQDSTKNLSSFRTDLFPCGKRGILKTIQFHCRQVGQKLNLMVLDYPAYVSSLIFQQIHKM